jgi:hypothetical protein
LTRKLIVIPLYLKIKHLNCQKVILNNNFLIIINSLKFKIMLLQPKTSIQIHLRINLKCNNQNLNFQIQKGKIKIKIDI